MAERIPYPVANKPDDLVNRVSGLIGTGDNYRPINPSLSDIGVFRAVRNISFFRGGDAISPQEVFHPYDGLEEVIRLNKNLRLGHRASPGDHNRKVEEAIAFWMEQIPQNTVAVARFEDGTVSAFEVDYRTNFRKSLTKKPSIVYLNQGTTQMVFREARVYDHEVVKAQIEHFKAVKEFHDAMREGQHADFEFKGKKVILFPEPYLIAALESAYLGGGPIVTPQLRVVDIGDTLVHYIRPWLSSIVDTSIDDQYRVRKIGEHIGAVQAYGLLELSFERQIIHYCAHPLVESGYVIVNIDPDLVMHRRGKESYIHDDTKDFLSKLAIEQNVRADVRAYLRTTINATRESYDGVRLSNRLLDLIPRSLQDSALTNWMVSPFKPKIRDSLRIS